jgi:excisionase family DNA binding protein
MKALTARQAALEIGVHPSTLLRWIDLGEGPRCFVKPGPRSRTVRIRREDWEAWLRQHAVGRTR